MQKSVLVVEDDLQSRMALVKILRAKNWSVIEAGSVQEAVDNLDKNPHMILLDLMLPDGEGQSVLEEVRSRGMNLVSIVMTASQDQTRLKKIMSLQPNYLFPKPLDCRRLFCVVQSEGERICA